jgi:hypothetical protein
MTQAQLLTLAEQHQAAHTPGQHATPAAASGPGLLAMARMQ